MHQLYSRIQPAPTPPISCLSTSRSKPINLPQNLPTPAPFPDRLAPLMKRPIGVILTCVVLGFNGAFQLLGALLTAVAAVLAYQSTKRPSGDFSLQNSGFLAGVLLGLSLVLAILAAWSIATLVGLARLRNWARYSVLIIGGCLAALSLLSILGLVFATALMPSLATPPNVPASTMHIVFLSEALFWIFAGAIAGWWLVYFNLRTTKTYFLPGYQPHYQPGPTA
jgi:hypothetical protein